MNFDFQNVLNELGRRDFAFQTINAVRPPDSYLFAKWLPEVRRASYSVSNGSMTVIPTMAGHVAMDAPYPPTGVIKLQTFLENTAKIANTTLFPEQSLRELLYMLSQVSGTQNQNKMIAVNILNFVAKVLGQSHIDTFEWMRGQALTAGAINWTFGGRKITVNYGIPSGNLFTNRTGNDAYGGSTSVFWADHRAALKLLKYDVEEIAIHPDMFEEITTNTVNDIRMNQLGDDLFEVWRHVGSIESDTTDPHERLRFRLYAEEGEMLDPADLTATQSVSFLPSTKIVYKARNRKSAFRVAGLGATDDVDLSKALGYTHIGPTVEGLGRLGRYANVYTPAGRPMQLAGDAVTNGLPVIENPEKIVVLSSDIS